MSHRPEVHGRQWFEREGLSPQMTKPECTRSLRDSGFDAPTAHRYAVAWAVAVTTGSS